MRVEFVRSGGFAGMRSRATVDSAALPRDDAERLRRLVEQAGFFELPPRLAASAPGGDRFQYQLTIEEGGRTHRVEVHEAACPPALRPLVDWLTAAAKPG